MLRLTLMAGLLISYPLAGRTETLPRTEVPIFEVDHYDASSTGGTPTYAARYYGVVISIGGMPVAVGLDTGSVGLRMLPRGIPTGAALTAGTSSNYAYGSNLVISGPPATALVSIGKLHAPILLQAVDKISCVSGKSCAASANGITINDFGFFDLGQVNAGFAGIMGILTASGTGVDNPLGELGVRRWIVRLPRPFSESTGSLVLNPTKAEMADYIQLYEPSGKTVHVGACLTPSPGAEQICGPFLLDTGTPGLSVTTASPPSADTGAQATLSLIGEAQGQSLTLGFAQGEPVPIKFSKGETSSFGGQLPFFGLDLLFDGDTGAIYAKPRRPAVFDPVSVAP